MHVRWVSLEEGPMKTIVFMTLLLAQQLLAAEKVNNEFYALIVSAEDSTYVGEKKLDYSSMDANRLARALSVAGKINPQNITNLKNPSIEEFDEAVNSISKKSNQKFMFYFSGHSNENGLHLKDGSITKSKFHDLLSKVKSKLKVVILDSCFSGALKSKGAQKVKPIELVQYNVDEPTGSIILTSSSGTELSYESERLKGSIFTYHLVSGLYGQADSNTDGLVTIDELYQYVYSQTKFQSTVSGGKIQSPEFHSQLSGQGALVIAYPAQVNGQLHLGKDTQGELTLASSKGINFFKFYKNKGEEKVLSVPKGEYDMTLVNDARIGHGHIDIEENQAQPVEVQNFTWENKNVPSFRAKGVEPHFLFGFLVASRPSTNENEQNSTLAELFLLSPSTEALKGRWRLSVHLGGQEHKLKDSIQINKYSRMSIGGEGNYVGRSTWNNDWITGIRIGTLTATNEDTPATSTSLTTIYFGSRFYPQNLKVNFDVILGFEGIKQGKEESKSVTTLGFAVNF